MRPCLLTKGGVPRPSDARGSLDAPLQADAGVRFQTILLKRVSGEDVVIFLLWVILTSVCKKKTNENKKHNPQSKQKKQNPQHLGSALSKVR